MAKKYTADTFEGAVTGTASGNVAKAGDTMTGTLFINTNGSGQIKANNRAVFGTHYTNTDVWIYGGTGDTILLGGGIGGIQNDVNVGNGDFTVLNGSVGIGTTSPTEKLHIADANSPTIKFQVQNPGTYPTYGKIDSGVGFLTWANNPGVNGSRWQHTAVLSGDTYINLHDTNGIDIIVNDSQVVKIEDGGNVGIGTTSPTRLLHVAGTGYFANYVYLAGTSTSIGNFYGSIDLQSSSAVLVRSGYTYKPIYASAFTVSSDYRLKSNIEPLENATSRLKQLEVHRFNWNDRLDEPKVDGFIAHEVSPIIPEAVLGEKDEVYEDGTPKHQGIDQAKIVPLLTAALQEAISKIENLEARIQILENQ